MNQNTFFPLINRHFKVTVPQPWIWKVDFFCEVQKLERTYFRSLKKVVNIYYSPEFSDATQSCTVLTMICKISAFLFFFLNLRRDLTNFSLISWWLSWCMEHEWRTFSASIKDIEIVLKVLRKVLSTDIAFKKTQKQISLKVLLLRCIAWQLAWMSYRISTICKL